MSSRMRGAGSSAVTRGLAVLMLSVKVVDKHGSGSVVAMCFSFIKSQAQVPASPFGKKSVVVFYLSQSPWRAAANYS